MPEQESETKNQSELAEDRWAVISFEKCEASGLTYEQAAKKMKELDGQKRTGLCIVTDDAAARVTR